MMGESIVQNVLGLVIVSCPEVRSEITDTYDFQPSRSQQNCSALPIETRFYIFQEATRPFH